MSLNMMCEGCVPFFSLSPAHPLRSIATLRLIPIPSPPRAETTKSSSRTRPVQPVCTLWSLLCFSVRGPSIAICAVGCDGTLACLHAFWHGFSFRLNSPRHAWTRRCSHSARVRFGAGGLPALASALRSVLPAHPQQFLSSAFSSLPACLIVRPLKAPAPCLSSLLGRSLFL